MSLIQPGIWIRYSRDANAKLYVHARDVFASQPAVRFHSSGIPGKAHPPVRRGQCYCESRPPVQMGRYFSV